jgi:F-type H+-transporting ATPase subunit delta
MGVTLISERYAKALFNLAIEKNEPDRVNSDMTELNRVCNENRNLVLMLRSPVVSLEKKSRIVNDLFGQRFSRVSLQFIHILIRKRRESFIPEIVKEFVILYKKHKNILTVFLTTARPADDKVIRQVMEVIKGYTDKHIELIRQVDPAIIGGFILSWGDRRYDASVSYQIERMKRGSARINLYVKGF